MQQKLIGAARCVRGDVHDGAGDGGLGRGQGTRADQGVHGRGGDDRGRRWIEEILEKVQAKATLRLRLRLRLRLVVRLVILVIRSQEEQEEQKKGQEGQEGQAVQEGEEVKEGCQKTRFRRQETIGGGRQPGADVRRARLHQGDGVAIVVHHIVLALFV